MATPHVSGLVALLLDAEPDASPELIRSALTQGAVDLGEPGFDILHGWGRVVATASLSLVSACPDGDEDGDFVCNLSDNCIDKRMAQYSMQIYKGSKRFKLKNETISQMGIQGAVALIRRLERGDGNSGGDTSAGNQVNNHSQSNDVGFEQLEAAYRQVTELYWKADEEARDHLFGLCIEKNTGLWSR